MILLVSWTRIFDFREIKKPSILDMARLGFRTARGPVARWLGRLSGATGEVQQESARYTQRRGASIVSALLKNVESGVDVREAVLGRAHLWRRVGKFTRKSSLRFGFSVSASALGHVFSLLHKCSLHFPSSNAGNGRIPIYAIDWLNC